jgi:hypothetical protein
MLISWFSVIETIAFGPTRLQRRFLAARDCWRAVG